MFKKKNGKSKVNDVNDLWSGSDDNGLTTNNNNVSNSISSIEDTNNAFSGFQNDDEFMVLNSSEDYSVEEQLPNKKSKKNRKEKKSKKSKKGDTSVELAENNSNDVKISSQRNVALDILKDVEVNENDTDMLDSEFALDELDVEDIEQYISEIIGLLGFIKSGHATYNIGSGDFVIGYYITQQNNQMIMNVPFSIKTKPYQIKSQQEQIVTSDSFSSLVKNLGSDMVYNVSAYRSKLDTQDLVEDYGIRLHKSLHSYNSNAGEKLASFYDERRKSFMKNMEDVEEVKYTVVLSKPVNLSIDEFNSERIFVEETKEFIRKVTDVMNGHTVSFCNSYSPLGKNEIYSFLIYSLSQTVANFNEKTRKISMTEFGKWGEYTDANIYILQAIDSLQNSIRMQKTEQLNKNLSIGEATTIAKMISNDEQLMGMLKSVLETRCKYVDANGKTQYISKSIVNNL